MDERALAHGHRQEPPLHGKRQDQGLAVAAGIGIATVPCRRASACIEGRADARNRTELTRVQTGCITEYASSASAGCYRSRW